MKLQIINTEWVENNANLAMIIIVANLVLLNKWSKPFIVLKETINNKLALFEIFIVLYLTQAIYGNSF